MSFFSHKNVQANLQWYFFELFIIKSKISLKNKNVTELFASQFLTSKIPIHLSNFSNCPCSLQMSTFSHKDIFGTFDDYPLCPLFSFITNFSLLIANYFNLRKSMFFSSNKYFQGFTLKDMKKLWHQYNWLFSLLLQRNMKLWIMWDKYILYSKSENSVKSKSRSQKLIISSIFNTMKLWINKLQ